MPPFTPGNSTTRRDNYAATGTLPDANWQLVETPFWAASVQIVNRGADTMLVSYDTDTLSDGTAVAPEHDTVEVRSGETYLLNFPRKDRGINRFLISGTAAEQYGTTLSSTRPGAN